MASHSEAEGYIADLNAAVTPVAHGAHGTLVNLGLVSYVKTIYIGYEHDGEMVAALYGHADRIEVALALAEDAEDPLLVDASHLTWRTLPVAAILTSVQDVEQFAKLAQSALERVRSRTHDVQRDNDFFIRTRRDRRGRR